MMFSQFSDPLAQSKLLGIGFKATHLLNPNA